MRLVAEADSDRPRRAHELAVDRHGPDAADACGEGHRKHRGAVEGDHGPQLTGGDRLHRRHAVPGAQLAVPRVRWAAALEVAERRRPSLAARSALDLFCDSDTDAAEAPLVEGRLVGLETVDGETLGVGRVTSVDTERGCVVIETPEPARIDRVIVGRAVWRAGE